MAEALLITAVAVGFYFATSNPYLRGVLDRADSQTVTGWAVDEAHPSARIELQLYIDDKFVSDTAADQFRRLERAEGGPGRVVPPRLF